MYCIQPLYSIVVAIYTSFWTPSQLLFFIQPSGFLFRIPHLFLSTCYSSVTAWLRMSPQLEARKSHKKNPILLHLPLWVCTREAASLMFFQHDTFSMETSREPYCKTTSILSCTSSEITSSPILDESMTHSRLTQPRTRFTTFRCI